MLEEQFNFADFNYLQIKMFTSWFPNTHILLRYDVVAGKERPSIFLTKWFTSTCVHMYVCQSKKTLQPYSTMIPSRWKTAQQFLCESFDARLIL